MKSTDIGVASRPRTGLARAFAAPYAGSHAVLAVLLASFSVILPADAARTSRPEASNRPAMTRVQPQRTRAASPARHALRGVPRPRQAAIRAPAAAAPIARRAAAGGEAVSPAVVMALGNAARASGADPALLLAMAWKESRLNPLARNPQSSARGLMQFTRDTWLEVVRDYGPKYGLTHHSALLLTDYRSGEISTRRPRHLTEILKLRDNPRLSAAMAAERISRKQADLAQALGRASTAADLYMVHLLGPVGAQRFLAELQRAPSRPVTEAVGADSLQRNLGLFTARDSGRPLSLGQVYQSIESLIADQRTTRAELLASLGAQSASGSGRPPGSAVEVADAR
ncbi:MAG: lytic transglycosylase domain-containing protein [Proteobacteria bacterium]|nr:MAG: lytic transglycosylase domain-containing protein [Pseudomonadota bacterium]